MNCQRAGCTGHYAADGYCDECGHKAPAVAAVPSQRSASVATPSASMAAATSARTGTTRSGRSHSRHLGANLVVMPDVPLRDPAGAVLANPSVSEAHRTCAKCGELVGQAKDGKPGRAQGFCPRDGTPFSFVPTLTTGELVSNRYEILGCIAHGGLGWIYLGRDRNISDAGSDRWVVLKGLINTGDADAMAAAVAERRFLVEVDHPNIVKIHDFASHVDPVSGENIGYIVMEYVGGRSLKDLALNHRGSDGRRAPLPLPQVLAYALEVLPAIGYLHEHELLFCDFKPDNVIHAGEQLKIIDLGAVRHIFDQESALYGTPGYQAPELATAGPSIGSDIYTIGRTMAVLSFDFAGFTTRLIDNLPDASTVPLLAAEESYDRLLRRATHAKPERRFASTADMAEQTMGVLREVLSAADGQPRPVTSGQFTGEQATFAAHLAGGLSGAEIAAALPVPLVDPTDPGAGFLATLSTTNTAGALDALRSMATGDGLEVRFRLVRALLEAYDIAGATAELDRMRKRAQNDWRLSWYAGLIALHAGDYPTAAREFDLVYSSLPGEIAPRLALAASYELAGDRSAATRRYERVWLVDRSYPSAAFGLARMRTAAGDRVGAIAVLDQVPGSSSQYVSAQVASFRASIDRAVGTIAQDDLVEASDRLDRLKLDAMRQATLSIEIFEAALAWIAERGGQIGTGALFGHRMTERELRLGLERAYRVLASLETDTRARHALVDRANAARPWTMV